MHKNKWTSKILPFSMIIMILVLVGSVIWALAVRNTFLDQVYAKQYFEELSVDYYENVVYPAFIENHSDQKLEDAFESYTEPGFIIRLRQILNNAILEKNADYGYYFKNDFYECDTNTSMARFFPRAPFGKTDYEVTYDLNCEKI